MSTPSIPIATTRASASGGVGAHTLLNGTEHSDTVAQTVSRGSLVYGNSTPAWDELTIGAANRVLGSDGTDVAWRAQSFIDHGSLGGLTDDDHPQYLLLAGRAGTTNDPVLSTSGAAGTLAGSTVSGGVLVLTSTTHATKGSVQITNQDLFNSGGKNRFSGSHSADTTFPHVSSGTNPFFPVDLLLCTPASMQFNIDSDDNSTAEVFDWFTNSGASHAGGGTNLMRLTEAGRLSLPLTGSTAGLLLGADTQIFRGAANRLDVASGDSLNLVDGELTVSDVATATSMTLAVSTNGTVTGSTLSGGHLILDSTTHATAGQIQLVDPLLLQTSTTSNTTVNQVLDTLSVTHTSAGKQYRNFNLTPTISNSSVTAGQVTALRFAPTLTFGNGAHVLRCTQLAGTLVSETGAGSIQLFDNNIDVTANSSSGFSPPTGIVFYDELAMTTTGSGSVVTSSYRTLRALPVFTAADTATWSLTSYDGLSITPQFTQAAGAAFTIPTLRGMFFSPSFGGTPTVTTIAGIQIENYSIATTNISLYSRGATPHMRHVGAGMFGVDGAPDTTNGNILEIARTHTLTAGIGDGQAACYVSDPGYTGAFTVTRHNYWKVENVSVAASAVVTDSCVMWFDAAAGTHSAVSAHTGAGTPTLGVTSAPVTGDPDAWVKINVNGTVMRIPAWA